MNLSIGNIYMYMYNSAHFYNSKIIIFGISVS